MKAIVIPILYFGPGALVVMVTRCSLARRREYVAGRLCRLAPEAQGRVLTAAAWAPPLVGVLFMGGGIADWLFFSGVDTFCLRPEEMMARPSILFILTSCIVSVLDLGRRRGNRSDLWRSRRVTRAFRGVANAGNANCRLLPLEEPPGFRSRLRQPVGLNLTRAACGGARGGCGRRRSARRGASAPA